MNKILHFLLFTAVLVCGCAKEYEDDVSKNYKPEDVDKWTYSDYIGTWDYGDWHGEDYRLTVGNHNDVDWTLTISGMPDRCFYNLAFPDEPITGNVPYAEYPDRFNAKMTIKGYSEDISLFQIESTTYEFRVEHEGQIKTVAVEFNVWSELIVNQLSKTISLWLRIETICLDGEIVYCGGQTVCSNGDETDVPTNNNETTDWSVVTFQSR